VARVFKTKRFARDTRKASISDAELCGAIAEVEKGQSDDLGGGVHKKRLNRNEHRSIILMKSRRYWIYQYLFAKKDRANIDDDELAAFKKVAEGYTKLDDAMVENLIIDGDLVEICNG
jgi:hypothetical protein